MTHFSKALIPLVLGHLLALLLFAARHVCDSLFISLETVSRLVVEQFRTLAVI